MTYTKDDVNETKSLSDVEALPDPAELNCAIFNEAICIPFSKDPLTIVTNAWGSLQLTWTFMLLFVHLTQVARAITTLETMKGQGQVGPVLTAITTGSVSADGAQVNTSGSGPDPVGGHSHAQKKKEGCLSQLYKILGLDTFYTVAFQGYKNARNPDASRRNKQSNPFSRGIFRNCQDFWLDGPVFKRKDNGRALLGGEVIDYTSIYEVPRGGMRYGGYEAVPTAEEGS